jgi:hypothetical protein
MVECGGVWSQAVGPVLVRLAEIWLQSPRECFPFNLLCKEILVNFLLSMRFTENCIATKRNAVRQKGGSFLPNRARYATIHNKFHYLITA